MIEISVVIPVKNAKKTIYECLKGIFSQKTKFSFEVIIIDSGSTDGTLQIIKQFPVKLIQIKPEEFKHSTTRNLGALNSSGIYLVFLNADAAPADENWLDSLIGELVRSESIAGAYSRQLPRPGCYAFVKKGIREDFPENTHIVKSEDFARAVEKKNYLLQKKLILFSTVSGAIRKDIWQKYPFDDRLNFAEDQAWAKKALESGYSIGYAADSKVYHSHNYSFRQWFKIKYIDFLTFNIIFDRVFYHFVFVLPRMFYNLLSNLIFVLKEDMPFHVRIIEIVRGEMAALVAAAARICASLSRGKYG